MNISLKPVAYVHNSRTEPIDDGWDAVISDIILVDVISPEAFRNIEDFSHMEILFYFDLVLPEDIVFSCRPRGNPAYPVTGIFAQRKKDRPNQLGLCTVQLIAHEGNRITVRGLDAIDATPVLDIKPVFKEFLPKAEMVQPAWVADLMKNYW